MARFQAGTWTKAHLFVIRKQNRTQTVGERDLIHPSEGEREACQEQLQLRDKTRLNKKAIKVEICHKC